MLTIPLKDVPVLKIDAFYTCPTESIWGMSNKRSAGGTVHCEILGVLGTIVIKTITN